MSMRALHGLSVDNTGAHYMDALRLGLRFHLGAAYLDHVHGQRLSDTRLRAPQLIPACSTFSSLLLVLTHNTKNDYTTHYTKHYTIYTPNTLYVTNLSTLKTRHLCRCLYHRRRPSHNFLFLSNQTCCSLTL